MTLVLEVDQTGDCGLEWPATRCCWWKGFEGCPHLQSATLAIQRLPNDSHLVAVERIVADAIRRESRSYNRKKPEVIVIASEADPRVAAEVDAACRAAEESGTYVRGHMQNGSPTQDRGRRQGRGGRTSQVWQTFPLMLCCSLLAIAKSVSDKHLECEVSRYAQQGVLRPF